MTIPNTVESGLNNAARIDLMTAQRTGTTAEPTSSLERYLAEVSDPVLRENLANEISSLQRQFGLVFERHHPEGIRLPKHSIKRGSKVVVTARRNSVFYRVRKIDREAASAIIVDSEGNEESHALSDLTVAKEFGDIMYPGLKKLSEIRNGDPEAPVHTIINGENYHALEALQYTHAGKVDLIYIDPPYNTGAADWKYNDRYVDSKDGYRHSKWLSFMEKRLLIAKSLLKPTGVVIMAIDDNEHHRLRMLADQIFGERNFLANLTWQGRIKNDARFGGAGVDYMLVFAKSADDLVSADVRWKDRKSGVDAFFKATAEKWLESSGDVERTSRFASQWIKSNGATLDSGTKAYSQVDSSGRLYQPISMGAPESRDNRSRVPLTHPLTGKPCKVPASGWNCSTETLLQRNAAGRVLFGKDENTTPRYKLFLDEVSFQVPKQSFESSRSIAAKHLEWVLGDKRFPFPKDHQVLMRWFRMVAPQDAVILDFFGGSGTTAEAVIRLNDEDGGSRQCILVTNNELAKADDTKLRKAGHVPGDEEYEALGVFHHVTKPRIETVVTGVRQDGSKYSDGLDGNVAFFELTYLDEPEIVTGKAFDDLSGLFWLKAGGRGGTVEMTQGAKADGFAISESGRTAVLFSPGRAKLLAEKLATSEHSIDHLFIVTDSEAQGDEAASHFAGGIIVERIYGSYLEAFQVNRKD